MRTILQGGTSMVTRVPGCSTGRVLHTAVHDASVSQHCMPAHDRLRLRLSSVMLSPALRLDGSSLHANRTPSIMFFKGQLKRSGMPGLDERLTVYAHYTSTGALHKRRSHLHGRLWQP
jgi:hypothetical protein